MCSRSRTLIFARRACRVSAGWTTGVPSPSARGWDESGGGTLLAPNKGSDGLEIPVLGVCAGARVVSCVGAWLCCCAVFEADELDALRPEADIDGSALLGVRLLFEGGGVLSCARGAS